MVRLAIKLPPPVNPPVPVTLIVAASGTPRLVLALAAVEAPVPPSDKASGVMPVMLPPVIDTALESCVDIVP